MPNLAATLCMVIGMTAFRRVPAMLNYTSGTDGIQSACVAAKISTIITSRKFLETARLQGQVDALRDVRIVYLEDLQPTITAMDKLWALVYICGSAGCSDAASIPTRPRWCCSRRGPKGRPKGVVLSHRRDPFQYRAGARHHRLLGGRPHLQCAADLPLLRSRPPAVCFRSLPASSCSCIRRRCTIA